MSTGTHKQTGTSAATPPSRPRPGRSLEKSRHQPQRGGLSGGIKAAIVVALVIVGLGLIFARNNAGISSSAGRSGGKYPYQVGQPGPGAPAPPIRLPATNGGTFDLAALRGQTVLLYFQEGIMCQPCWDQIAAIEAQRGEFEALGIDRIVSITTDPLDALRQKVANERITIPVLSDPDLRVSKAYQANLYGMMGASRDGHSFILIDKEGTIAWRADYGGAPKYTMYVPVPDLIADLRDGLAEGSR